MLRVELVSALSRMKCYDSETKKILVFLADNFTLKAFVVCMLNASRVEIDHYKEGCAGMSV